MSKAEAGPINSGSVKSPLQTVSQFALNPADRTRDGGGRVAFELSAAKSHALAVIQRLQSCLDKETAALTHGAGADFVFYNNQKGQGLVDLSLALKATGVLRSNGDVTKALGSLRAKIHDNMRVLRLHVAAVEEISVVLSESIRSQESDGTYSASVQARRGAI